MYIRNVFKVLKIQGMVFKCNKLKRNSNAFKGLPDTQ